jgi:uncharacterized protein YodC (DUF2158 family)
MTFQPGDIVSLKSGGQYMTVAGVSDDGIECIWIGEEGDFFRETVPSAVLKAAETEEEDDDDSDEADADGDEDDQEEEARKIA